MRKIQSFQFDSSKMPIQSNVPTKSQSDNEFQKQNYRLNMENQEKNPNQYFFEEQKPGSLSINFLLFPLTEQENSFQMKDSSSSFQQGTEQMINSFSNNFFSKQNQIAIKEYQNQTEQYSREKVLETDLKLRKNSQRNMEFYSKRNPDPIRRKKKRNNQNLPKYCATICRNCLKKIMKLPKNNILLYQLKSKQANYPTIIYSFQIAFRNDILRQFEILFIKNINESKKKKNNPNEEREEMQNRVLHSLQMFKQGQKYKALRILYKQKCKCPSKQKFEKELEQYVRIQS